ncbi:MAG: transglutaminase domain-containing protein, partial [Pseudomonadota bacterium]
MIHDAGLAHYGLSASDFASVSRQTLPVAERLSVFAESGGAVDLSPRPPQGRSIGTCRDYALLMTGFLREHGIEARVRCGFASYFAPGRWEDHWICEYRLPGEEAWRMADAQMDGVHREVYAIDFEPQNLPDGAFCSAGRIWSDFRAGRLDPETCGAGERTGTWIMAVDVARDYLALCGQEVSPWDGWR